MQHQCDLNGLVRARNHLDHLSDALDGHRPVSSHLHRRVGARVAQPASRGEEVRAVTRAGVGHRNRRLLTQMYGKHTKGAPVVDVDTLGTRGGPPSSLHRSHVATSSTERGDVAVHADTCLLYTSP